jgi:hypothetical protein
MSYQQREVVELQFRLPPDGDFLSHPAVIISNDEINELEGGFTAVMITHTDHDDEYSFPISNEMFSKEIEDNQHQEIRLHLISYFLDSDVIKNAHMGNRMKIQPFRRLITQVNEIVFRLD